MKAAFVIDVPIVRDDYTDDDDDDDNDEEEDRRLVLEIFDTFDDIMFAMREPYDLRGELTFRDGSALVFSREEIESDWETFYLVFVRIALALDARPEALIGAGYEDDYAGSLRGMVKACVEDLVAEYDDIEL